MKGKVRLVCYLPRRLIKILWDIAPLFADYEIRDPRRGAVNRALEHILQRYMESEDYQEKMKATERFARKFFDFLSEKDLELLEHKMKEMMKD